MPLVFNPFTGTLDFTATGTIGGTGYDTIQEEGGSLTQRTTLNFVGRALTAADDGVNVRTNVTLSQSPGLVTGTSVVDIDRAINTAAGELTGGGNLSVDRTLGLANTGPGVTGPLGDATHTPVVTIDAKGRVTALSSVLTTTVPGGPAGGDLAGTYPNPTIAALNGAAVDGTTPLAQGDLLVANATPALSRFAGNATVTKNFLSMTSSIPLWTTLAGADVAGAALTTGAADPNVTIALGGTPATALLRASSITLGWTGQLAVSRGGTGLASGISGGILGFTGTGTLASSVLLTQHALVVGGGAGATPSTPVGLGTSTTVLHGNAVGDPSFAPVSLSTDVTGALGTGNGGTGQVTPLAAFNALSPLTTEGDLLTFAGGANARLPVGAVGRHLRSDGTDPVWVDVTLFDDFSQYTLKAGRAGALNDTILTSTAAGTGTLTGAASGVGTLALRGAPSVGGTLVLDDRVHLFDRLVTIAGTLANPTKPFTFNPTASLTLGAGKELDLFSFGGTITSSGSNNDWVIFRDTTAFTVSSGTGHGYSVFAYQPVIQSSVTNANLGIASLFTPTVTFLSTGDLSGSSGIEYLLITDAPALQTNGANSKLKVDQVHELESVVQFVTDGAAGQSITLGEYIGVLIKQFAPGGGTQTNTVTSWFGLDFQDPIVAGITFTNTPVSFRSQGPTVQMRHAGPVRIGSSSAGPTGGSILHVDGGLTGKRTSAPDAAYTVLTTDLIIEFPTLTATRVVNLPASATVSTGKIYIITKNNNSAFDLTVTPNGTEKIDGAVNKGVGTAGFSVMRVYSTGVAGFEWKTF